jgi:hypothetical protein
MTIFSIFFFLLINIYYNSNKSNIKAILLSIRFKIVFDELEILIKYICLDLSQTDVLLGKTFDLAKQFDRRQCINHIYVLFPQLPWFLIHLLNRTFFYRDFKNFNWCDLLNMKRRRDLTNLFYKFDNSYHGFVFSKHSFMVASTLLRSLYFNLITHQDINFVNSTIIKIESQTVNGFLRELFVQKAFFQSPILFIDLGFSFLLRQRAIFGKISLFCFWWYFIWVPIFRYLVLFLSTLNLKWSDTFYLGVLLLWFHATIRNYYIGTRLLKELKCVRFIFKNLMCIRTCFWCLGHVRLFIVYFIYGPIFSL